MKDFCLFPGVLEGLGSSGRLIGSISTYPGTYKCAWSRVMAKNPPGRNFFTVYGTKHASHSHSYYQGQATLYMYDIYIYTHM